PTAAAAVMAEIVAPEPPTVETRVRSVWPLALNAAGALPEPARGPEFASLAAPSLKAPPSGVTPARRSDPGRPSALTWPSGASCGHGAFEAWRGRKLDVQVQFVWHDTWNQMAARLNSPYFRTALTWTR